MILFRKQNTESVHVSKVANTETKRVRLTVLVGRRAFPGPPLQCSPAPHDTQHSNRRLSECCLNLDWSDSGGGVRHDLRGELRIRQRLARYYVLYRTRSLIRKIYAVNSDGLIIIYPPCIVHNYMLLFLISPIAHRL